MPPMYIDGNTPLRGITSLDASVGVTTPILQHASGDKTLAVPAPATNDTLALLTSTQTLSCKTLLNPTISSAAMIMSGGQMSGGILINTILGPRTVVTLPAGVTKTLDFSTADVFIVPLTGFCTLTVSNAETGKGYQVVLKQDIANSFTGMSWMSNFACEALASGPSPATGAVDVWTITFDGTYHYGVGAKNVQG